MTDRVFRFSQTSTFMQSRSKYLIEYIYELEKDYPKDRPRPAFASDVGVIGHRGLEAHYKGHSDAFAHLLMRSKARRLNVENTEKIKIEDAYGAYDRFRAWADKTGLDRGFTPLAVEKRIYLPFGTYHGDNITLTFEPDIVVRDKFSNIHVNDWKFVDKYESLAHFIGSNRQGLTYSMGIEEVYGQPVTSFSLHQIKRTPLKTKEFIHADVVTQWIEPAIVEKHRTYLQRIIADMVQLHQEVEAGDLTGAYPNPTYSCANMCSHYAACCGSIGLSQPQFLELLATNYRKKEQTL